jgi:site-specific recombinase XerD
MTQQSAFLEEVLGDIGEVETLEQGLVLFQTVGMPARNLSARTRIEYTNDLTDLIEFLAKRGKTKLAEIWLSDLEAYQAEMDRRSYEGTTRKRKTYAIKTWFTYLHHCGVLIHNVAERLIPPQPARREPRFLSEDEYQRLLRACSHNARDSALIEVLLQTGRRLSELARLTINDIELPRRITRDPDNTGTVRVLRKGGKIDTIPLNYKACQAIASYLRVRPKVDHSSLFVTKFHTPMSKRAIQHTVAIYLNDVGIRNASVHTLRHTMATHHVARGTDLKTVQETLGHASLETTTIYVSLAKKAQRKALQEHAL